MSIPRQPPFAQQPGSYPPQYTITAPRKRGLARLRESTIFHVAVTAAAGGVAAYYGTRKVVREHSIDVYFKIEDELDRIVSDGKKKNKKSKKD